MFNMAGEEIDVDKLVEEQSATAEQNSPPDSEPMSILDRGHAPVDLGLAGEYARLMYDLVGSHMAYHELGGLVLFGAAIQHRFIPVTWAQREKMRPNLYGCVLGRSTFDHKSTALSKTHETMPWDRMTQCASLPGMFTEEGLYKELTENPMGLIVRDEAGVLFASRNRRYTEFVIPFLTDAFGGWMYSKRLASQSYQSREVALSILGATTYSEFARTTSEGDWESGWLVRWLYALPDAHYDPTRHTRWPTEGDRQTLEIVKRTLSELNKRTAGPMRASQEAFTILEDWRRDLILQAMATNDRHERADAVIERLCTAAYKFSMILCAARGDGETVTGDQAQDACRLAENYMTNVFRLYQYQREHRLTGALLQKALAILNKAPEGMNGRELQRQMHVTATMRDEVIQYLLGLGAVSETVTGRTTRYNATIAKLPPQRLNITR